jgi:mRNA-degrading endonuclease toxin of MazEF toxin-antitoxin module
LESIQHSFHFLDSQETKTRPIIVVSQPQGSNNVIVVAPISSKIVQEDVDFSLHHWSGEGLLRPSVARVHRVTAMLQSDLIAEIGELIQEDKQFLQTALKRLLNL